MENQKNTIPQKNIERLETQGFTGYTAEELSEHQYGIRFAYWLCASFVALGIILNSIPVLVFALLAALGAVIHNRHPFDYIYNNGVRQLLNKPKSPKRAIQGKIACGLASVHIIGIILSFYYGHFVIGYIIGGTLLSVALLVASTDFCIPSVMYKYFMKNKTSAIEDNLEKV